MSNVIWYQIIRTNIAPDRKQFTEHLIQFINALDWTQQMHANIILRSTITFDFSTKATKWISLNHFFYFVFNISNTKKQYLYIYTDTTWLHPYTNTHLILHNTDIFGSEHALWTPWYQWCVEHFAKIIIEKRNWTLAIWTLVSNIILSHLHWSETKNWANSQLELSNVAYFTSINLK